MSSPVDIREQLFKKIQHKRVSAVLTAEAAGVASGIQRARGLMQSLGLEFASPLRDAVEMHENQVIARVRGDPLQIALAEERIIGCMSKSSGIATAARDALGKAGHRCRVVSGGWKKMPPEIKELIRQAVRDGGMDTRISREPFIYLDKNYVRILGGVSQAVRRALPLRLQVVIQVRGEGVPVSAEAVEAARAGAAIVMVDSGNRDDLLAADAALHAAGLRTSVRLAFAGNIRLGDIAPLSRLPVDVLDVGYGILDAPCLPMRFDVIEAQ